MTVSQGTVIHNEQEFIDELARLMKQGKYKDMQTLALRYEDSHGKSRHAAVHAALSSVYRELNDYDRLQLHMGMGKNCTDCTDDLFANMKREMMLLCDKYGLHDEADELWSEITALRDDPAQKVVDAIARAKGLYYRRDGVRDAHAQILEAGRLIGRIPDEAEIVEQDVLDQEWWSMQISTAVGDHGRALRNANSLVFGRVLFGYIEINPDQKPSRIKLATLMLQLDHKPRFVFGMMRSCIIRLARWHDLRH